jgi:hypothetical protein
MQKIVTEGESREIKKMGDKIEQTFESRHFIKLQALYEAEKNRLNQMKHEYSQLPDGEILIPYKNAHATYYVYKNGVQKSVKRDEPVVNKLMRKRVLKRTIMVQEVWCKSLNQAEKNIRRRLKSMRKKGAEQTVARILAMPESDMFIMEPGEYKWRTENNCQNPYRREQLKYRTSMGVMVRSKSEKIIADKLEYYDIPYRYEAELVINGNRYYPDFMVLLPDGRILIWEHFGLMDDIDYSNKAWQKIENYRIAGYVQHTNLICTYESDIENDKIIDEIIKRFILQN